jgi:hypothetical protein
MLQADEKEKFLNQYKSYFTKDRYEILHLKNVEKYNDLVIIKKLNN